MSSIDQSRTAAAERGYDHPIDRMDLGPGLVPVYAPVATPLFTPEQEQRTVERLSVLGRPEVVLRMMAGIALRNRSTRQKWEEANLRVMGIIPERPDEAMRQYTSLAGVPEAAGSFMRWVGEYSTRPMPPLSTKVIINDAGLIQGQENEFIGGVKGYTFAVGASEQNGLFNLSTSLDLTINKGLNTLRDQYGYAISRYSAMGMRARHRAELIQAEDDEERSSEVVGLHVIREREFADINSPFGMLHIIKRFNAVVALRGMRSTGILRDVIASIANNQGEVRHGKRTSDIKQFMQEYELRIHQHSPTLDETAEVVIWPQSTTYLIRNPKKNSILSS